MNPQTSKGKQRAEEDKEVVDLTEDELYKKEEDQQHVKEEPEKV